MLKILFVVLTLANFGYAALHGYTWDSAIERTYFQGVALLSVFIYMRCTAVFAKQKSKTDISEVEITSDLLQGHGTEE